MGGGTQGILEFEIHVHDGEAEGGGLYRGTLEFGIYIQDQAILIQGWRGGGGTQGTLEYGIYVALMFLIRLCLSFVFFQ